MYRILLFVWLLLLALPGWGWAADLPGDALVEGRDYILIAPAQSWQPADGRIEVVEVFAYTCVHCARFQPLVDAWAAELPEDVRFYLVPSVPKWDDPWARACLAATALGVLEHTHAATYQALHRDHRLPRNPSIGEMATFYASLGLDGQAFSVRMQSPEIDQQMQRALEFLLNTGVRSTPSLIVGGKYLVLGQNHEAVLAHADGLIARERAAGQR